jgi:hypothetical protein
MYLWIAQETRVSQIKDLASDPFRRQFGSLAGGPYHCKRLTTRSTIPLSNTLRMDLDCTVEH